VQHIWQDLRYGARMLVKKPGFTLIAVLTLALGIGVNTALFTGFNIFLRPKPVKDPDSLVTLQYHSSKRGNRFSFPEYAHFRDHTQVFSDLIANQREIFLLGEKTAGVQPEEIDGNFVSDNFFATLGGRTMLGRFFTQEENAVVVLSHHFWQRRFAGDPQMVGRTVLLDGQPFTVIGVTSADFVGLRYDMPDIWLPLMQRAQLATVFFEEISAEKRDWFRAQEFQWLELHARLKPGTTPEQAQPEMGLLLNQLAATNTEIDRKDIVTVTRISEVSGDNEVWGFMGLVLGASGLVLLIACSNIANMLLARAASRQKEIGMRLCLGASRLRVIRQLLTESFLLAGIGGLGGVLLAWWSLDLLFASVLTRYGGGDPGKLAVNLSPDLRVLAFSVLLSLLCGIAFGLVPALRASRPDLVTIIKDENTGVSGRDVGSWLRSGLIVAQVSLCLILLIPAGLLLRGLRNVLASDPGFEVNRLLFVTYSVELSGYDLPRGKLFHQQLMARLAAVPGVQSVTPERDFGGRVTIIAGDRQYERGLYECVSANYLETIGTPLTQGRGFTVEEVNAKAPVVIVSEATARNLWPNENPLGKTVRMESNQRDGSRRVVFASAEVVGVARDNQVFRIGQTPPLFVYAPQSPTEWMDAALLVRTTRDPESVKEPVRREAFALEPVLRLGVNTMKERLAKDTRISETRAAAELAVVLGVLALGLAALGIYGVMSFAVTQRTREIGIRMALGANRRGVLRLMMVQGLRLVVIGVILGVPCGAALARVLSSMLFGLSPFDPLSYAGVTIFLVVVALLACWFPARRATKVDPMVALRYE